MAGYYQSGIPQYVNESEYYALSCGCLRIKIAIEIKESNFFMT